MPFDCVVLYCDAQLILAASLYLTVLTVGLVYVDGYDKLQWFIIIAVDMGFRKDLVSVFKLASSPL